MNSLIKQISFYDENLIFRHLNTKYIQNKRIYKNKFEISLQIKGFTKFKIAKNTYKIEENQILIIPPKLAHDKDFFLQYDYWELISIIISEKFIENLLKKHYQKNEIYFSFDYILDDKNLSFLLKNLILDSLVNEKIDENKFFEFFNYLFSKHLKIDNYIDSSLLTKKKFDSLFDELSNGNYDLKELDFYKMAEIMNMNPYYFHRIFSKTMGITPQNFINSFRLCNARRLLSSNESLASISQLSGFYDQAYFTKQFKKHFGITPSNYKNL